MKNLSFLLLLLAAPLFSFAQTANFPVEGELVVVNKWGSRGFFMMESFFKESGNEIVAKIGKQEFEQVKARCDSKVWPSEFDGGFELSEEEEALFYENLNQLKMYRICTYQHIFNGEKFEEKAIIRIPYEGNETWNENVTWEGNVYFIINNEDVVLRE